MAIGSDAYWVAVLRRQVCGTEIPAAVFGTKIPETISGETKTRKGRPRRETKTPWEVAGMTRATWYRRRGQG
jgi:hypothetical protein